MLKNYQRLNNYWYEFQTQLAQQAKIAELAQEALVAQQAQSQASEEVTFLQMVLEGIADVDWVTQVQLANKQKQINALKKRQQKQKTLFDFCKDYGIFNM
jgi:hypothetical protein